MLLVEYDQADVRKGAEHSRTRAHRDLALTMPYSLPLVISLAGAQPTMQQRNLARESTGESVHCLWCQPDFRDQDNRLPAGGQGVRHRAQIHFGFSAARDSVEQEHRAVSRV